VSDRKQHTLNGPAIGIITVVGAAVAIDVLAGIAARVLGDSSSDHAEDSGDKDSDLHFDGDEWFLLVVVDGGYVVLVVKLCEEQESREDDRDSLYICIFHVKSPPC